MTDSRFTITKHSGRFISTFLTECDALFRNNHSATALPAQALIKDTQSLPSFSSLTLSDLESHQSSLKDLSARTKNETTRLHYKAQQWLNAAYETEKMMAACPDFPQQDPVELILSLSEPAKPWVNKLERQAFRLASFASLVNSAVTQLYRHILPVEFDPALAYLEDRFTHLHDKMREPQNDLLSGPMMQSDLNLFSSKSERIPLYGPLLEQGKPPPHIVIPTPMNLHAFFPKENLRLRGWSDSFTRSYVLLHEWAHAHHFNTAEDGFHLLALDRIKDPNLQHLLLHMISPSPDETAHPPSSERHVFLNTLEATAQCLLKEGYADCFAVLGLSSQNRETALRLAKDCHFIRSGNIPTALNVLDAHAERYLRHDTREALMSLSDILKDLPEGDFRFNAPHLDASSKQTSNTDPSTVNPIPFTSFHDLALHCALQGLGRWLTQVATLPIDVHHAHALSHDFSQKLRSANPTLTRQEARLQDGSITPESFGFSKELLHQKGFDDYWKSVQDPLFIYKNKAEPLSALLLHFGLPSSTSLAGNLALPAPLELSSLGVRMHRFVHRLKRTHQLDEGRSLQGQEIPEQEDDIPSRQQELKHQNPQVRQRSSAAPDNEAKRPLSPPFGH